jgi:hypothetical protein
VGGLVEVLYPVPDIRRTPLSLLRWWESRRLLFNEVVGATGVVTLAGAMLLGPWPADAHWWSWALPVAAYAGLANLCYSWGWGLEMLARWVWGRNAPFIGPLLFRQGLIFSVGITLLPLVVITLISVLRVVMAVVGLLT